MNDLKNLAEKIRAAVNEAIDAGILDEVAVPPQQTGEPNQPQADTPTVEADNDKTETS